MATKTPLDPGVIARAAAGARNAWDGFKQGWFGPWEPMPPVAPQTQGRAFDYPTGFNLQQRPKSQEGVSFTELRAFADSYDLLRLVIETRKDQIQNHKLKILSADEDAPDPSKKRRKEIMELLRRPDGEHSFQNWIRMALEDLFVLDAIAVYARPNLGGGTYALELLDAATIKRLLDERGRTPLPPAPAYQQVLKGLPANNLTTQELSYSMRNPRTSRVYGLSPVEQIIMTVNIALRRQIQQLDYFTAGTIPDAFGSTPEDWSTDQLEKFQRYWDSYIEGGGTSIRRKMRFIPGKMNITFSKDAVLKDLFDEWLARIVCFCFSISPTMLVKETNRATADSVADAAKKEGLLPLLSWLEDWLNNLLTVYYGVTDVRVVWDMEEAVDPLEQAQVDQIYVNSKIRTPDEIRVDRGWPVLTEEQKAEMTPVEPPGVKEPDPTGKKVVPIKPDSKEQQNGKA